MDQLPQNLSYSFSKILFILSICGKQKGQISDHPSSREEPDDNIFLIVSDEEDGNK